MNIATGQIVQLTDEQKKLLDKMGTRLVSIDESLRTEREKITGQVLLSESTDSPLARQLRAARSAYIPHVGAKELTKAAQRGANIASETRGPLAPNAENGQSPRCL